MMYLTSGWTGHYLRLASLLPRATGYLSYIEYGTVNFAYKDSFRKSIIIRLYIISIIYFGFVTDNINKN